jgi:hypothetical protein
MTVENINRGNPDLGIQSRKSRPRNPIEESNRGNPDLGIQSRKSRPRNPTEDLGNIYDVKDNKESIRYYQK